jgi:antitoxin component YwqK of YwqJK toxin-antitoxin module
MKIILILSMVLFVIFLASITKSAECQNISVIECKAGKLKVGDIKDYGANLRYLVQGTQVVEHGVCLATNSTFTESFITFCGYKGEAKDILPSTEYVKVTASGLEPKSKYYANVYVINKKGKIFYGTSPTFILTGDPEASKRPDPSDGPKKEYYANGKLMREFTVKGGALNGVYKMYSDSGYLITDQFMKDGMTNGYFRTYYKNGNLRGESNYIDGMPIGSSTEYYEKGTLKLEMNCSGEAPNLTCQSKEYYEEGTLKKESKTGGGEFISSVSYDQEGRVRSEDTPGRSVSYWYDINGVRHVSINGVEQK